jgi:hypothetical protein
VIAEAIARGSSLPADTFSGTLLRLAEDGDPLLCFKSVCADPAELCAWSYKVQRQRGAALASSPSIVRPRSACDRNNVALRGADLTRGEHPGHQRARPRRKTMRHWITSFRLLIGRRDLDPSRCCRKTQVSDPAAWVGCMPVAETKRPSTPSERHLAGSCQAPIRNDEGAPVSGRAPCRPRQWD